METQHPDPKHGRGRQCDNFHEAETERVISEPIP
jgi:hypothetical protein